MLTSTTRNRMPLDVCLNMCKNPLENKRQAARLCDDIADSLDRGNLGEVDDTRLRLSPHLQTAMHQFLLRCLKCDIFMEKEFTEKTQWDPADLLARLVQFNAFLAGCSSKIHTFHYQAKNQAAFTVNIQDSGIQGDDTGGITWPAADVLVKTIIQDATLSLDISSADIIIELGCGTGLVGLSLAKFCQISQRESIEVFLTDYDERVLETARRNIHRNQLQQCCISTLKWSWTDANPPERLLLQLNRVQQENNTASVVIVAADVVYAPEHAVAFAQALNTLAGCKANVKAMICLGKRPRMQADLDAFEHQLVMLQPSTWPKQHCTQVEQTSTQSDHDHLVYVLSTTTTTTT